MMLFNKLLQAVPILSFSVNADMPVGMLPIDFDPGFNQAVIPLLFAVSSYADDSFSPGRNSLFRVRKVRSSV